MGPPLNNNNYLNLFGYIVNTLVTFAASGIFGFPDNAELSEKYQTLVTPSGITFAIWGIIFLFQAIFAILQMLPKYRHTDLVQEGVGYWYFVACTFQSLWTFAFGYEVLWLSVIFMGGILVSLFQIVKNQSKIESDLADFWLFKFPFSIHVGWIAAAFAVNFNVLIFAAGAPAKAQVTWAVLTLFYVILVATFSLASLSPFDFTIPLVLIWASIGIATELKNPKDSILYTFTLDQISKVRNGVVSICVILALAVVSFAGYRLYKARKEPSTGTAVDGYNRSEVN
mmetsp:Transcript_12123/g.22698  ORF Transcript_12123/g.22698 Transcript_12123/m.22698 type:complete len:284 (+) Transcript_12123:70-921(+)|eukprot:CAMPEP_0176497548 /NCGR_PEP_ID=MMETSP0200_2-20121128/11781_1 /TAXON_ID=947934 /ORGANISM="Chaetoceros sp., Strain GSL56" /LENGTH=283 /DNA_ID=CAMNT_0017895565 /DNA_START=50 /DNA_END=901 /DNA_ORIENTATION=+